MRTMTADGRAVFVKRTTGSLAVEAEVAGLRWLADAGAVPAPAVLEADADRMVIEWIDTGEPSAEAAETFGRGLAALHNAGAAAFGVPPPNGPADAWIGLAAMVNQPAPDWPAWYAENRILPYLRRSRDAGTIGPAEAALVERVAARLPDAGLPVEPPARLHGDLWQGNVLWGRDGVVWVIDPAAHGGHRETDLAMLAVFGCPHLDRILAAYDETAPLAVGWRDRVGLHQLFPLLVHTELFGAGYVEQTVAAARSALAVLG